MPAVSCLMSMLPPFFRGGIVLCPPGRSSAVPITPGKGSMRHREALAGPRVGAVGQIPDLQEGLREIRLGQQAAAGPDRGPAEVGRLHLEDLHHQRVARARAAHPYRPGQGVPAEGTAREHVGVGGGA